MKRSDTILWSQVKVGVFIVFALLFFAGGVLLMGQKTKFFMPKGRLSVIMHDVAGLKVGAPVWLAGIDVGLVREIRFERPQQSNEVEIVLEIDRQALKKIGKDSRVSVKTRGLMGEKYVDITPSQSVAEVPETRIYGTPVPKLDDVMQKAGTAFDHLNDVVEKMNRGEGTLGRFATDPKLYNNLVGLSAQLSDLTATINRGEGSLGKLSKSDEPYNRLMSILTRTDMTLKQIQTADGTMNRLINDRELYTKLVALAEKSVQAAEDVRELNRKLTSRESSIGMLLQDRALYDRSVALLERADQAIQPVEAIAVSLKEGEGTAGKLISDRELYDKTSKMIEDLDVLITDFKAHPRRYIKFSVF